jgi:hypothetical protein
LGASLSPGGRVFLDGVPDAADEDLLKMRLQQRMPAAAAFSSMFPSG